MGVRGRGVIDCRCCAEWSRVAEGIDQAARRAMEEAAYVSCTCSKVALSPSPTQPNCFSAFESFLSRSRHVSAIILTISPRNSTVLSFSNPAISGVISFLSARRVTPVPFCGLGQRLRAGGGVLVCHIAISVESKGSCNP
jgi:hypothetical protein